MVATTSTQPLNDLQYDLLTVLQSKAEAVKAYETYIKDAQAIGSEPCVQLFQKLHQQDTQQIQEIRHHLQEVLEHGKM